MLARVSNLEAFRQWKLDEESELGDILPWLNGTAPASPAMLAGTAFHSALERAKEGQFDVLKSPGYVFYVQADIALELPEIREIRCSKKYGPLTVTGQVDAIVGKRVEDHKTTSQVNAERYFSGYQWRYYLEIHNADVFRWNVFEIREAPAYFLNGLEEPPEGIPYVVHGFHQLEQYRYPGMDRDCERLAEEYYEFASKHL